jgi:NADH-quinone oxidoreductase subunit J
MSFEMLSWWLMAALAIACAVGMVSTKNPVHSALWLVLNFSAIAVIYLILNAPVLFAIQLIVYAGAIMVLFLFVVMYFMGPERLAFKTRILKRQIIVGGALALAFILVFAWALSTSDVEAVLNEQPSLSMRAEATTRNTEQTMGQPAELGRWLFSNQVLPFELTSILLLLAILGAMMVARDVHGEGREEMPAFAAVIKPQGEGTGAPPADADAEGEEVEG